MFDPVTIATGAVAVLSPYLAEGGKKIAGKAGEAVWDLVKGKLTAAGESKAVERFERAPTNPDSQGGLRGPLVDLLTADPQLLASLASLVQVSAPSITQSNSQTGAGSININVGGNLGKH